MFDVNRIIIVLLLIALLYSLYRYQQQITINNNTPKKIKKKKKKTKNNKNKDTITIDNISQASLGSLLDTDDSGIYKQQDSLDDNTCDSANDSGSITSLLEDKSDDNFFFQEKV